MFKKFLCCALSAIMLVSVLSVGAYAYQGTDYTIVNPYETVDWDTWTTYKANLHTHSTASDGRVDLPEMIGLYYDLGYDVLALTDHGVINHGWNKERKVYPPFNLFQKLTNMSDEDYERITTGSDRGGRGMTDVTGGIEINMAVLSKTHVNGYFTEYGSGVWGTENDYESAPAAIEEAGGYSVLNHVGDWVDSNHYPERSHHEVFISYFANIFNKYHSCLGMEIINNTDNVTRADRALWDELLKVIIPTGRNIWAFADDDSEYVSDVGRSFEMMVMPENNLENVKTAMENGTFFACSKYARTEIGNDFIGTGEVPLVKKIKVDQRQNTIELELDESRDCSAAEWVYDNKVIAVGNKIDLNDYEDEIGCYIRFQLKGEGGITYSQAFELKYDGRTDHEIPEVPFFDTRLGRLVRVASKTRIVSIIAFVTEKIMELFR